MGKSKRSLVGWIRKDLSDFDFGFVKAEFTPDSSNRPGSEYKYYGYSVLNIGEIYRSKEGVEVYYKSWDKHWFKESPKKVVRIKITIEEMP